MGVDRGDIHMATMRKMREEIRVCWILRARSRIYVYVCVFRVCDVVVCFFFFFVEVLGTPL